MQFGVQQARIGLEPTIAAQEQRDAAGGRATGIDLTAVSVEYTHAHIGFVRWANEDELIAANAQMAIGNGARARCCHLQRVGAGVDDNEIIAKAMHFPEPANHGRSCRRERSEEHTSKLQSLMRNSYAVFCMNKIKFK